MSNQEAWNKFMQTGRVDYFLLSRGINIYADGKFPLDGDIAEAAKAQNPVGGDKLESDGCGHGAEGATVGRQ